MGDPQREPPRYYRWDTTDFQPGGLAAIGFIIFGVIAALAFAVAYLVIRMRRKPKAGPMIPPPPQARQPEGPGP